MGIGQEGRVARRMADWGQGELGSREWGWRGAEGRGRLGILAKEGGGSNAYGEENGIVWREEGKGAGERDGFRCSQ